MQLDSLLERKDIPSDVKQALKRDITKRKQAEIAIKESEEKFRLLSEQNILGIVILQDGLIKYVNNACAEIIEHSPKEMLDWAPNEFVKAVHPEDRPFAIEQARKKQLGEPDATPHYSFRLITKTGNVKWIDNYSKTIMFEGKSADFSTLVDITERINAEEGLRESEERMRAFMDSATDAFSLWDSELNLIDINKAGMEMIPAEFKETGVIGKNFTEFGSRARETGNYDRYMEVIRTGEPLIIEDVITDPVFGNIQVVVKAFKVGEGMGMIVTDITDRKQAEEELQASEEKHRSFVENFQGIAFKGYEDYSQVFFSGNVEKITGYTENDFVSGKVIFKDLIHPKDSQRVANDVTEFHSSSRESTQREYRIIDKYGRVHWLQEDIKKFKKRGVYGTLQDITNRKQAEKALRESEEKYRTILDSIEDGYYEVDLAGNFTFFNDSLSRLFGYSINELMAMNYRHYMDDEYANKVYQTFNTVYKTGQPTKASGWEIIRKDGTMRFNEASVSLITGSSGEPVGFRGIVRDITERKEMEEALRESEEKFRNIIESIPLGMHMYHLMDDGNLIFTGANRAAYEILGVNNEQFVGKTIEEAFPSSIETEIPVHYRAAAAEGTVWANEDITYEDEKIKGAYEVSAFQTSPGKMVASFLDIAERKKTEESLRESERKYRTLITTMTDGIVAHDVFNRIILINPALESMLGYSEEEMLNHLLIEFLDPDSIDIFKEKTKQRHSGLIPSEEYELIFTSKDGFKVTTRVAAKVLMDGSQIRGSFAVISDITKERELEQRRASFMSMTAHELRTPTTIIRGYAELLETLFSDLGLKESDKLAIPLQKISKNVQRLERLISDVRGIMRIDMGIFQLQKEPVIINELLDEFLGSYKVFLKDQLEYSISNINNPIRIESDPVRLLQVFGNLMQNAIDHTSKENRQITVCSKITSEDIVIEFSDNGAGIEPQYLEKIFEPFVSVPTEFTVQGTGVGLHLSRYIMEAHDGTLLASSKGKGFGAIFTVRLPRN